jgi:O-antigen/teichoic acid export membrane protein
MVMTGHERQAANILAAVVVLNAIVSLVLIPLYGGVGAAAATAFSIALWSVLGLVFVYRRLRYRASIL